MLLPKHKLESLDFYTYVREHPSFKLAPRRCNHTALA